MNFKKKILSKFFYLTALSTCVILPLVSCTNKSNSFNNVSNDSSNDISGPLDDRSNITLSSSILNSGRVDLDKYKRTASNDYGLFQNKDNFSRFGNFEKFSENISLENLEKDLLLFLYNLWISNRSVLIYKENIQNLKIESVYEDKPMSLNNCFIGFELKFSLKPKNDQNIKIFNETFFIKKDVVYDVEIIVEKQKMLPTINKYLNYYCLGWLVGNAKIKFNSKMWIEKNFSPTINSFSHAFKNIFINLTDMKSYSDLYDEYSKSLNDFTDHEIKNSIEKQIIDDVNKSFDYIDIGNNILSLLSEDISIDKLLKGVSKQIIEILTKENIIPEEIKPFLLESLYSSDNSNSYINNKPFINVFDENKEKILLLLRENFGSLVDLVLPTFEKVKSGIKENTNEHNELKQMVSFLPEEIQNMLLKDFLGIGASPKPLFSILFDNYSHIFNLIGEYNETIKSIKTILDMFLIKKEESYKSIYDVILGDSENRKNFLESIISLSAMDENLKSIINVIYIDNTNLTKDHFLTFTKTLSEFSNKLFIKNNEYKNLSERYSNLIITNKFTKDLKFNRTNKIISYKYDVEISIKEKVELNLKSLKDLVSKDSIIELIVKIIPEANSFKNILGSINVDTYIKDVIPTSWLFGSGKNKTTFSYSCEDTPIQFKPIKKYDNYNLGFDFINNLNIYVDDPGFIENLTKNNGYKKTPSTIYLAGMNVDYTKFWTSLLQNVITRDYDSKIKFSVENDSVISTIDEYNENLYIEGYSFEDKTNLVSDKLVMEKFDSSEGTLVKDVKSNISDDARIYTWSDNKDNYISLGKKPISNENINEELKSFMYDFSDDLKNLKYYFDVNPILNFTLPLNISISAAFGFISYNVNVDVRIFVLQTSLYFPFKVYDLNSKKMVDKSIKTFTYFGVSTKN